MNNENSNLEELQEDLQSPQKLIKFVLENNEYNCLNSEIYSYYLINKYGTELIEICMRNKEDHHLSVKCQKIKELIDKEQEQFIQDNRQMIEQLFVYSENKKQINTHMQVFLQSLYMNYERIFDTVNLVKKENNIEDMEIAIKIALKKEKLKAFI